LHLDVASVGQAQIRESSFAGLDHVVDLERYRLVADLDRGLFPAMDENGPSLCSDLHVG
jgi:hypothetical protein